MRRDGILSDSWGQGSSGTRVIREGERDLEQMVSAILGSMLFLTVSLDDEPGPASGRSYIERNSIALLSNFGKTELDAPSPSWLGNYSPRTKVQQSGLWNQNHIAENYDPAFLETLAKAIEAA